MIGYAESPQAWARARRMAQVLGVNLAGAVVDGWLARRELGQIVECCRTCRADAACGDWLDRPARPACTPAFCANGSALAGLSTDHA